MYLKKLMPHQLQLERKGTTHPLITFLICVHAERGLIMLCTEAMFSKENVQMECGN